MRKAYYFLGAIVILGIIWAIFSYRNFTQSLIPPTPTNEPLSTQPASPSPTPISTFPPPLPSPSLHPTPVPEVQAFIDSLEKDSASLTCTQDSDCQWYGRGDIYSSADNKTHSLFQCRNSQILNSCPNCILDNSPISPDNNCRCLNNLCD
ncbi:MAG: hypothetical protein ABII21_00850 [bacterium]